MTEVSTAMGYEISMDKRHIYLLTLQLYILLRLISVAPLIFLLDDPIQIKYYLQIIRLSEVEF